MPFWGAWMYEAEEVAACSSCSRLLDIEQLSRRTGLSTGTIQDLLTRERITNDSHPRSAICRPAYRHGSEPLWSENQLWAYRARVRAENARYARAEDLRAYSVEEARESDLVALRVIAARWGMHPASVRRWQRTAQGFPRAVGKLMQSGAGRPDHLYRWSEVVAWRAARR